MTVLWIGALAALPLFIRFDSYREAANNLYDVRFGIIGTDVEGDHDVIRETTVIPLYLQTTGFYWGYSIQPPDERPYTTSEVMTMPRRPRFIDFPVPVETSSDGRIIRTPNVQRQYFVAHSYGFSEGDPLGDWKLQIYINDRLSRTVRFLVAPPDPGGPYAAQWRELV